LRLNKIYNTDCLEGLSLLHKENGSCVDLILTDPPYNISNERKFTRKNAKTVTMDFGEWDKFSSWEEYAKWLNKVFELCFKVLKPNGQLITFAPKEWQFYKELESFFEVKKEIIWHKTNPTPQFMKVSYLSSFEKIYWCVKPNIKSKDITFNFKEQRNMHNFLATTDEEGFDCCIQTPICMGNERKEANHPTAKRIDIIKHFIEIHTNPNDIILDPFIGSGTTAIGCKETNRQYIGFELDNKHFNNCCERISKIS
jgi:DNA modification methylase